MTSSHPYNNFTAVRLTAALMVLFAHMFAITGRVDPFSSSAISIGGLAVMIFFSISGYLVTASWRADSSVKRFMFRRVLRLWPAMALTFFISMLIIAPLVRDQSIFELLQIKQYVKAFGNLFFYPNYRTFDAFSNTGLPIAAINGSLWTIPLEFLCYLIIMLLGFCFRSRLEISLIFCVVLAIAVFIIRGGQDTFSAISHPSNWYYLYYFGTFFLIGGLLNYFKEFITFKWVMLFLIIGSGFGIIGQYVLAQLAIIPLTTLWISTQSWPGINKIDNIGDYSYGAYLYAWPMQQIVTMSLGTHASFGLILSLSILLTLSCAIFSWHLVEKPLLAFKPRRKELSV